MSVGNTGENKVQKYNRLLKLGGVLSYKMVKVHLAEEVPFE